MPSVSVKTIQTALSNNAAELKSFFQLNVDNLYFQVTEQIGIVLQHGEDGYKIAMRNELSGEITKITMSAQYISKFKLHHQIENLKSEILGFIWEIFLSKYMLESEHLFNDMMYEFTSKQTVYNFENKDIAKTIKGMRYMFISGELGSEIEISF